MLNPMNMDGRVIMITGAAQGIGRGVAQKATELGATLVLVDLNEEGIKETAEMVNAAGVYVGSVADPGFVQETVDDVVQKHGVINGLFNNAGIISTAMIHKMSVADWQAVIDVNLTGSFLCGREFFVKLLEQKKPGVCINISSLSRSGNMGQSNYTATKAGVAEMTVTWAKEMARHGIRVAAIAPGYINTEMTSAIREDVKQKIIDQIPLKRMGEPNEISHSVFYILENDYFTGRVIECDGGFRI